MTAHERMKFRLAQVHRLKQIVEECRPEQIEIFRNMNPEVGTVMASMQIAAIRKLTSMLGLSDAYFLDGLAKGFALCGDIPSTGRWKPRLRSRDFGVEHWSQIAFNLREMVLGRVKSAGDDVDAELWGITQNEVASGWLQGPYEVGDAVKRFGDDMVPARRFLVQQKGKSRPVDDYSISMANATVQSDEQPYLDTLDMLVAQTRFFQRELIEKVGCRKGVIKGRTFDLENAFRQLATDPDRASASCIVVFSPEHRRPMIFRQLALPFGSRVSVYAFARLSEFLSCSFAAEECMRTLGIRFSVKDSKRRPFSCSFRLLGVTLSLNVLSGSDVFLRVANTPERVKELRAELELVLKKGTLEPHTAARLRGRLGFFISALWNRAGALFMRALEMRASMNVTSRLTEGELFAVEGALTLLDGRPRDVNVTMDAMPYWVYTDAAAEPGEDGIQKVTVGGLLHRLGKTEPHAYFAAVLPQDVIASWRDDAPMQAICQAEALAVLIAKVLWGPIVTGARTIYGIDNVGAMMSYIRMTSSV
eukprot:6486752-Amphidinium_carterae.3